MSLADLLKNVYRNLPKNEKDKKFTIYTRRNS
jgi:hypothetical protein